MTQSWEILLLVYRKWTQILGSFQGVTNKQKSGQISKKNKLYFQVMFRHINFNGKIFKDYFTETVSYREDI